MTHDAPPVVTRKKLIEVALPLDAINAASKREKSIRHGHPSTLHLWWARRPLAAARAVIFAQMVDDPSACTEDFPKKEDQDAERERLFGIIEQLVRWENTTNETVLEAAREEIRRSWRRACADNADHPQAAELFDPERLPAFHDPFAGGGSLPLEAQRLGLEAHASDLNPVAVLINKAMIEIPPRFAGNSPVNPESRRGQAGMGAAWKGAAALAEDVRYYGKWMRHEVEKSIGHLYPKVRVTEEMVAERPDLKPYAGRELTVIAWLWARTVKSPNPAFTDIDVPLASTFLLSKKKGREAYVEPVTEERDYRFIVRVGKPPEDAALGTKLARSNFKCAMSGTPIDGDYIKSEGRAGRMGERLMAIVTEGDRGRVYLAPLNEHERIPASVETPAGWLPEGDVPARLTGGTCVPYGLDKWWKLFTGRQLVTLATFSDLVGEARERVTADAVAAGLPNDGVSLREGGTGATAYGEAAATLLAFAVSKTADSSCTIARWQSTGDKVAGAFGRQAIPMIWDFAEANVFSSSTQNWLGQIEWVARSLESLPSRARQGAAFQGDAVSDAHGPSGRTISTDPPYYDNVAYADLSDFFYVWLRRSLRSTFPDLFATLAVPKAEELVAAPYRHGTKDLAEAFFLDGMTSAMRGLANRSHPSLPITIYYAFKQSETSGNGVTSSGWETFLDATMRAGFEITATWPLRTERTGRPLAIGTNALATSVVLACLPRPAGAPTATRREFAEALRSEFPGALAELQKTNIAPVDLAQASIGPGMAVFTRYREVLNADGSRMSVRDALGLINATLDETLAEQEGDFDADTRWALTWFEQHGFEEGEYGEAEQLSKARNTSVEGLVRAGVVESRRGSVRLERPSELDPEWNPETDTRLTVWEMTHHLIRALDPHGSGSEGAAATLAAKLGSKAEAARELAYRLYVVSERKRRAQDALSYNALVQSWPEIARLARERRTAEQGAFAIQDR
ncbi:MAG: DUF1156 domain-containing protein [Chloroflexi bacterium]|nr:DUF1156 domain-containing protein [Chloroflexota bacterium]